MVSFGIMLYLLFFLLLSDLGTTTYPTYGFIYQDQTARTIASAVRGVQTAMGAVASAVPNAVSASGNVVNSVRICTSVNSMNDYSRRIWLSRSPYSVGLQTGKKVTRLNASNCCS